MTQTFQCLLSVLGCLDLSGPSSFLYALFYPFDGRLTDQYPLGFEPVLLLPLSFGSSYWSKSMTLQYVISH